MCCSKATVIVEEILRFLEKLAQCLLVEPRLAIVLRSMTSAKCRDRDRMEGSPLSCYKECTSERTWLLTSNLPATLLVDHLLLKAQGRV